MNNILSLLVSLSGIPLCFFYTKYFREDMIELIEFNHIGFHPETMDRCPCPTCMTANKTDEDILEEKKERYNTVKKDLVECSAKSFCLCMFFISVTASAIHYYLTN